MIAIGNRRLFLYGDAVDMRKGIDGLASIVLSGLRRDPCCGDIFVFVGRRRNLLKALCWDGDGYWLVLKRLAEGRFVMPQVMQGDGSPTAVAMDETEWRLLLDGIVIRERVLLRRHKRSVEGMAVTPRG